MRLNIVNIGLYKIYLMTKVSQSTVFLLTATPNDQYEICLMTNFSWSTVLLVATTQCITVNKLFLIITIETGLLPSTTTISYSLGSWYHMSTTTDPVSMSVHIGTT